ncbi:MAG TPA: hypothetical protein VJQ56_04510 [Blastocatellia bacterium]|nr:hypothetical protein [Blastocatellia bacterium]
MFDDGNRNIATLIGFLIAIMIGVGSGWMVGSALSNITDSANRQSVTSAQQTNEAGPDKSVVEKSVVATPVVPAPDGEKGGEASKQEPAGRDKNDKDLNATENLQAKTGGQDDRQSIGSDTSDEYRSGKSRRAARRSYVGPRGDSVPMAIIKGKPIRKAFSPLKKVKFW